MTFKRVFCLHTREVPLGVDCAIAILVHIASTLDMVPMATAE